MVIPFPFEKFQFKSDTLFLEMPKNDVAAIENKMVFRRYKKGQTVFVEGSYPSGVFYLKEGLVKKFKTEQDFREQIFYICNSGEFFGFPALLSEETYTDSATTLEESVVGFISKKDFFEMIDNSPMLAKCLLKNLSHEFGVLVNHITTFAQKNVRERLALTLTILKVKYQHNGTPDELVEINLSREDLAHMVGTVVETLVRLMREFKEEGLIETHGRTIRLLDPNRLVEIANFY